MLRGLGAWPPPKHQPPTPPVLNDAHGAAASGDRMVVHAPGFSELTKEDFAT